jgi:hypothetical protein
MGWKDLSELHIASKGTKDDVLFDRVLQGKIAQARWELAKEREERNSFKSGSDPLPPESDLNESFPVYKVRGIKELNEDESQEGWFCPLFMRAGDSTIFGGAAKESGKTMFYAHMLKCVHDGKPFMGMPTRKSGALVLTEQGTNILEAIRKAGIEDDDEIYFGFYRDLARQDWASVMAAAVETCEKLGVKILVVDTFGAFAKLRGSDENLSGEIIECMEPVLDVARVRGLHVSILHHTGKDGDLRGSSAFKQDPDCIWTLKRPVGDHGPNVRALEGMGRYDEVNTYFNLALEADGYRRLGTNSQIERAAATNKLLEMLPVGEENAKRRTALIEEVSDSVGVSQTTVRRALEDLIENHRVHQGRLHETGRPQVLWKPDPKRIPRVVRFEALSKEDQRRLEAGELPGTVYAGRGKRGTKLKRSKYANPFIVGKDGDRSECIEKFKHYLEGPVVNHEGKVFDGRHLLQDLHEIRGMTLCCHCSPQACHCDELLRRANDTPTAFFKSDTHPIPSESDLKKNPRGGVGTEIPANTHILEDESFKSGGASGAQNASGGDLKDFSPSQLVKTPANLITTLRYLEDSEWVAIDIETSPSAGWKTEVLSKYRDQLSGLKKRPKVKSRKTRLAKIKERTYSHYATDTDVALPRVISVAAGTTNVLVDVTKVDPTPLLELLKTKTIVAHNAVFDLGVLRARYNYTHEGRILDTQLLYTLYHYAEGGQRTKSFRQ